MQMMNNQLVRTDDFILPTCAQENEAEAETQFKNS